MTAVVHRPEFVIREGLENIDFDRVQRWLASSYWSPGISRETVEAGARNSALVLGAFDPAGVVQTGYARVVSDKTRFAYVCDVWVEEAWRGRGIARGMVRRAMEHPEFSGVATWALGTKDAQQVYSSLGFRDIREEGAYPNTWMVFRKSQ